MVYLSLPLLYDNFEFNKIFSKYILENRYALKFPFWIESTYGSFPYCCWNGDLNSTYGNNILYPGIEKLLLDYRDSVIRLDFSNIFLTNNDFYNIHENTILRLLESNGTMIELSNLELFNYINSKYKGYDFVLSSNANLIHPLSEDIINIFIEQNEFILISLNNCANLDLTKIKNKNKLEILINNECSNCTLETQQKCKLLEQNNQISFSSKSIHYQCPEKVNYYEDENHLLNEINNYLKMGFTHFKIGYSQLNNIKQFNKYLICNLIQEEYQNDCLKLLEDYI